MAKIDPTSDSRQIQPINRRTFNSKLAVQATIFAGMLPATVQSSTALTVQQSGKHDTITLAQLTRNHVTATRLVHRQLSRDPLSNRKRGEHRFWVMGCLHLCADIENGLNTFETAIRNSIAFNFDYQLAIALGDFAASKGFPSKFEGEVVKSNLKMMGKKLERLCSLAGNCDASPDGWFQKYALHAGGGEANATRARRYSVQYGNILFLFVSDENDIEFPRGRRNAFPGGHPAGAISQETFEWLKDNIENTDDRNIIVCAHHMLKDTTFDTSTYGGVLVNPKGGYISGRHQISAGLVDGKVEKTVKGLSYLRFIGAADIDDGSTEDPVRMLLNEHPGIVWLGAHTHGTLAKPNGQPLGHVLRDANGNTFINCSALCQSQGKFCDPTSRIFLVNEGSRDLTVKSFVHPNQLYSLTQTGWHDKSVRKIKLRKPFAN